MDVHAEVWIGNQDDDEYWAEGVKARVEVETTDADEVRIGVQLSGEQHDAASIYVSRENAEKLSRFLSAAAVLPVKVGAA